MYNSINTLIHPALINSPATAILLMMKISYNLPHTHTQDRVCELYVLRRRRPITAGSVKLRPMGRRSGRLWPISGGHLDPPTNCRSWSADRRPTAVRPSGSPLYGHIVGQIGRDMDSNGFYKVIISYIVFIYAVREEKWSCWESERESEWKRERERERERFWLCYSRTSTHIGKYTKRILLTHTSIHIYTHINTSLTEAQAHKHETSTHVYIHWKSHTQTLRTQT